ncbi:Uncharacterised protein [Mycobacteroides abscessus subsp. abscessus]|nr:Uncharacterised protein [Mycobacteroides abscessus subsp. abscessus]
MVLLVSMSPCHCILCAKFFALLGLVWVRARKSSPSTGKMAQKWACYGVLGEFFRGNVAAGALLGELCRAVGLAAKPFY